MHLDYVQSQFNAKEVEFDSIQNELAKFKDSNFELALQMLEKN